MSIKIKTISMVRIPPLKCRKYLFHVSFIAAKIPAAEASQLSIISDLLRKQNPCINYHYMHIYVGYRLFLRLYDL